MKKIILHVGPHKTGSTYIQKYLYLNREYLFEHGWNYPEPIELNPEVGHYGHRRLGFDETQISYYLSHSENKKVIFSSENLYLLGEDQLNKLFKAITNARFEEIIVVFYARNPIERAYSFIKELFKGGWHYTIPEFLSIYLLSPFKRKEVNYSIYLDTVKKFDPQIIIIDYEYFSKNSLLIPLLEIMEIPVDKLNLKNDIVNKGIKLEFAEMLRYLNLKSKESGYDFAEYKLFNAVRKVLSSDNELKEEIDELQNALSEYKESIIIGSFIPSALERLFSNKYSSNFYKGIHESWSKKVEINYISERWMVNKNLLKTLDKLYTKCLKVLNHASNISQ